ncbi:MAG: AbiJ-NTD4 domain-containing protein [Terriglobales bacterium]
MAKFSERHGYKTARQTIQVDSISAELRNSLWSLMKMNIWDKAYYSHYGGGFILSESANPDLKALCERLWFAFFKRPLDTLDSDWRRVLQQLRDHFFACSWFEVYDFVEFIANNFNFSYGNSKEQFIHHCNTVLETEVSAYRFVNGIITKITDQVEIAEIDQALESARGPVRTHLRRALEMLSDRESPDYRNSIKESISAVESLVATVLGKKGTLGQLVKKLEDEISLHPALGKAFGNLYGYTSDQGGIRHAILESKDLVFEDAKFFLVVCSAFVNFVESKGALSA